MRLTKSQLKEIIRQELKLTEGPVDPDDAGEILGNALGDLQRGLKKAKNIEKWASKYYRQLPAFVEMVEKVTSALGRMK
jgi:hypothetical protein